MRFKRFTFSLLSPLLGFHYGKNPVSGQRFLHIAPLPFFGIDFEFKPYLNDKLCLGDVWNGTSWEHCLRKDGHPGECALPIDAGPELGPDL